MNLALRLMMGSSLIVSACGPVSEDEDLGSNWTNGSGGTTAPAIWGTGLPGLDTPVVETQGGGNNQNFSQNKFLPVNQPVYLSMPADYAGFCSAGNPATWTMEGPTTGLSLSTTSGCNPTAIINSSFTTTTFAKVIGSLQVPGNLTVKLTINVYRRLPPILNYTTTDLMSVSPNPWPIVNGRMRIQRAWAWCHECAGPSCNPYYCPLGSNSHSRWRDGTDAQKKSPRPYTMSFTATDPWANINPLLNSEITYAGTCSISSPPNSLGCPLHFEFNAAAQTVTTKFKGGNAGVLELFFLQQEWPVMTGSEGFLPIYIQASSPGGTTAPAAPIGTMWMDVNN